MRYTEKQKLLAVQDYLAGTGGLREVAKRHGVNVSALRSWISAFREHGQSGIETRTKRARYDARFKLSVLQYMQSQGLSYRQTAAVFDIRRFDVIGTWQKQYDEGGVAALSTRENSHPKRMP